MLASVALRRGVLYVGRFDAGPTVQPFDLDGRPLSPGFRIHAPRGERQRPIALDVDSDHHVWIADAGLPGLRRFTLVGREVSRWSSIPNDDTHGSPADVVDVEVVERDGRLELLVATNGHRRHAVQLIDISGRVLAKLRSEGDPRATFQGVSRVSCAGERTLVCEPHAGRVQVFRNLEFEFLFKIPVERGRRFEPVAAVSLADGRMIVANGGQAGALLLVDRGGRLIRVLAEHGSGIADVSEPLDLAVDECAGNAHVRLAVIDQLGERVQVLRIGNRNVESLAALPGPR